MTPLQAIRHHCLWCCLESSREVGLCPAETCPVHAYRAGHMPRIRKPSPLRAIRARCLDCVQSNPEVRACETTTCSLHPFRMGKNPNYSAETRERLRHRARNHFLAEKVHVAGQFGN